jgi:thiol-disulfide isomerase/thioredoxin
VPSDPPVLTVFGAPECCLCDEAKPVVDQVAAELGIPVEYVDITGSPELEAAHRTEIPVGFVGDRKVFKYRAEAATLRRVLERA